ncbi:MAG: nickel-dependent lactate racemase [Selenomonadaceae bacterium]|nr:nickel-dependent lactate racemase [Selenomonadaceae bacterium]
MREYTFHYGRGTKSFSLDETRVIKEVDMPAVKPLTDIRKAVLDAIYHPIGQEPIDRIVKPGDTITFICNDPTRVANSQDFMPILVEEMNRLGVPDENMQIVFALGAHRLMTEEEMREGVGEEVAGRLKMYNSDARVPSNFEYFGTTSRFTPVLINKHICHSDHVFLTGTIVHHYFSGYGGGRKAVLPGCAALETIRHNHSFMMDPHAGLGKTTGNPVYEDQMEGVGLWAKGRSVILFNAILDAEHRFLRIFAGDYVQAHQEACKFVDEVYGVPIPKQADVTIASCGGYPKDINVYQMQKTMDNAVLATRQGGVVILLAECEEGSGNKVLEDTCRELKTADAIEAKLRERFLIGANKAYAVTRLTKKAHFILVTGLDRKLAKEMLFDGAVDTVEEALTLAKKYVGDNPSYMLMPTGSLTVPLLQEN